MNKIICSLALAAALGTSLYCGSTAHAQVELNFQVPTVRIQMAPPPPQVEVRPVAPSPRHVWVNGHWRWDGGRHVWMPGRWIAERPGHVWVDGRWVNQGGQWVFYNGHWAPIMASPPPPPGELMVQYAPPAPIVETVPVLQSPQHFWVPGHWFWAGNHWTWIPGHQEIRRAAGWVWDQPHWAPMPNGTWRYVPGRWRQG